MFNIKQTVKQIASWVGYAIIAALAIWLALVANLQLGFLLGRPLAAEYMNVGFGTGILFIATVHGFAAMGRVIVRRVRRVRSHLRDRRDGIKFLVR